MYVHIIQVLRQFTHYEHLYTKEQQEVIAEFLQVNNHLSDVEGEIENYEHLEEEISALPSQMSIGNTILLSTGWHGITVVYLNIYAPFRSLSPSLSPPEPLKMALTVEAKSWKTAYGKSLNERYCSSMDRIVQFTADYSKKLARPIKAAQYIRWSCVIKCL